MSLGTGISNELGLVMNPSSFRSQFIKKVNFVGQFFGGVSSSKPMVNSLLDTSILSS